MTSDAMKNNAPSLSPTPQENTETEGAVGVGMASAIPGAAATPIAPASAVPNFTRKVWCMGLGYGLVLALATLLFAPVLREWAFAVLPESKFAMQLRTIDVKKLKREAQLLTKRVAILRRRFEWLTPHTPYLIVDTSENRIHVMVGSKKIHEGICSTGSYVLLKAADERQWVFFTPRGMFHIIGKKERPVWAKPDWAFVEEGLPVPPLGSPERFEAGVLGEYALELGDGYLIHGTLYKRMLGMPVTHGCVRLDDEDLRIVYQNLQVGSRVFIY